MPKYLSGMSTVVVVLLILGVVAALIIGNEFYKSSTEKQATSQTTLEPQGISTIEEDYRPHQQETKSQGKEVDESTKQDLINKAILGVKSSLTDADDAKFKIDSVRLDVHHGGSREDVVCGRVNANNKPDARAGETRFVWHSSEEVEMESEDGKALFQLAWSLFCRG